MIEYENLYKANEPYIKEFDAAYKHVINSGRFVLGNEVCSFEEEFGGYCGAKHCVGVGSGTDALIFSLMALGLPDGSEVIIPSNAYVATVLSVLRAGHKPVLVEPDSITCNINPQNIEDAITTKTRAVLVVHLYGKACNMGPITEVCKKHGLSLVEDCAQAHGARYKGRRVGTFGDIAAFSFYPTKNLGGLGDGGAVITNIDSLAEDVRMLRNYGFKEKNLSNIIGCNSRLDELQASFLRVKLRHLNFITMHKRALASVYMFSLMPPILLPFVGDDYFDVYHIFNIRCSKRDALRGYLMRNGIGSEIHYPVPPHKQLAFPFLFEKSFPVSERIHETTLSLPISVMHTEEDVGMVAEVVNEFVLRKM
ncbi:MAG TPA: DegT/DnrJ/EryC1/StrS family aminotransferase [bacterium]|nr:DegT/DnrJ/EryC1/StrS family aminotransferase [bacterium]